MRSKDEIKEELKGFGHTFYSSDRAKDRIPGVACLEKKKTGEVVMAAFVGDSHVTGGSSGGNCWGGESSPFSVEVSGPLNIESLDNFIRECMPDLPALVYMELVKAFGTYTYSNVEYYGNYTDYVVPYLPHQTFIDIVYGENE